MPYYYCWLLGGVCGLACAVRFLRVRNSADWRSLSCLVAAVVAFAWGAKLQSRLEWMPLAEALRFGPRALLWPGYRFALGGIMAALGGLGLAVVLRAPWRSVADSLALAGSLAVAIGRLGCVAARCCLGRECPDWLEPFCISAPSGAVPLVLESGHAITRSMAAEVFLHPVGAYYSLAAAFSFGVLVSIARRAAPPGAMFLAYVVLGPGLKIGVDQFRLGLSPRAAEMMLGLPVSFVLSVVALVALRWSRGIGSARA